MFFFSRVTTSINNRNDFTNDAVCSDFFLYHRCYVSKFKFVVTKVIRSATTRAWPAAWRELVQALPNDGCCYFVCDFVCHTDDGRESDRSIFGLWTPEFAATKQKVYYHQVKESVKRELKKILNVLDFHEGDYKFSIGNN